MLIALFRSLLCALSLLSIATASEYRETIDFVEATDRVTQYAEEYGATRVLLVVDIDNTLLAMNHPLGSDQWFEWQEYLLEQEPDSPHRVADDFAGLLEVQSQLFDHGRMHPPQENIPRLIEQVQSLGVTTLVLTSRGDPFRQATEREMQRNGYHMEQSALVANPIPQGTYLPYELDNLAAAGLSAVEARLFRLGKPRPVSYASGIFMTAGQHKGAMLLTMLHKVDSKPLAVVFVDDHGRHVHRVSDALARRDIESTVFHYHREDEQVRRFRYSDKREVIQRWQLLQPILTSTETEPSSPPAELVPSAE